MRSPTICDSGLVERSLSVSCKVVGANTRIMTRDTVAASDLCSFLAFTLS